jgi:hypothetical protein
MPAKPSRNKAELSLVHPDLKCCVCGSEENVETCHDCLQRHYCSVTCQKLDRKLHRLHCLVQADACETCGEKAGLKKCSGCLQRNYCSPECQAKAWKEHKVVCKAYKYVGLGVKDPDQVAIGLMEYAGKLGQSNLRESDLRVAMEALAFCKAFKVTSYYTLAAMGNISNTLAGMSRYEEAEIFARERVTETDKVRISD